jgi:hypothetical protein
MADPLADLANIGQKALSLPADVLAIETRQMTEKVNLANAKVQELGTTLIPAGGLALPPLPGLPGSTAATPPPPAETRSEAVQGVRTSKKTSYLKV